MRPNHYYCTYTQGNCTEGNDYEDMLKMLLKFNVPIVTIHKGNSKSIISFACNGTIEYIFEGNELFDIRPRECTFSEWILTKFVLLKGDESIITIYNR